jgi:hypothetical protein
MGFSYDVLAPHPSHIAAATTVPVLLVVCLTTLNSEIMCKITAFARGRDEKSTQNFDK